MTTFFAYYPFTFHCKTCEVEWREAKKEDIAFCWACEKPGEYGALPLM